MSALGGLGLRALALAPGSGGARAPSHSHLKRFVANIRTPKDERRKIIEQRRRVRNRIVGKVERAGLRLGRCPNAGSYAKHTGLRRYMQGSTKIGGSDLDLPFVLSAASGDHLDLTALLDLFEGFVRSSYSRSKVTRTKSSIKLELTTFKYPIDIVPMVAVAGDPRREYLFRSDGTKVATSVSEHVRFVTRRTRASGESPGIVRFNDLERLFKWWRTLKVAEDDLVTELPTFLLELLCAKVFDEQGVSPTYTQTLRAWFRAMAEIVEARRDLRFGDELGPGEEGRWRALDPVNHRNDVVPARWTEAHIDRLGVWLRAGHETLVRVEAHDEGGRGKAALRELETLFGPAIRRFELPTTA
jgi:hypothetical protein